jgi:hypothetical protein
MFGLFKKGLYRRMSGYCDAIQIAVCMKLVGELTPKQGREKAIQVAAAIANLVFAKTPSPVHAELDQALVKRLSADFISREQDTELFQGIILALRTMFAIETDQKNTDATSRIAETIEWIKTLRPLPTDAPSPENMEALSALLRQRYPAK